jgi:hypothetical protein
MRRFVSALALAVCAPFVVSASGPDPNVPYIQSIAYGGSGCPQGTAAVSVGEAQVDAVIGFDAWIAFTGGGVPPTEFSKNCQINVNLHLPPRMPTGLVTVTTHGWAQLPGGAHGRVITDLTFSGRDNGQDTASMPIAIHGPVAKTYETSTTILIHNADHTASVAPLNIQTQVSLTPPMDPGQMTADYIVIRVSKQ